MGLTNSDIERIKGIFNEQFLQNIADRVVAILQKTLDARLDKQESMIDQMKVEVQDIRMQYERMEEVIDRHEQAYRCLNVRVFGIPVEPGENLRPKVLQMLNNKMKLNVENVHIQNCYRVGAKTPVDKPPAVLIRFSSEVERELVLRNRRLLKGSDIQVKEDLTKRRLDLLREAVEKFTSKNAWVLNGTVYIRRNNKVHKVYSKAELNTMN